jgi:predicted metalloprotease with PDZ domain
VWAASQCSAAEQAISLYVDATDAPRRLLHSQLTLEVSPGKLTLVYPRWGIQTYGAPAATVDNIVGLTVKAGDRSIDWARDPVDMFAFHLNVPEHVSTLQVSMDVVAPVQRSDMNAATGQLLVLDWQTVFLYPQGANVADMQVKPRLRLPQGWQQGSALRSSVVTNDSIEYQPTSLANLVDSPVLAGKYFNTTSIRGATGPAVFVHIAADTSAAARLPEDWQKRITRIVNEAGALFGGYPYSEYHFLLSLSDQLGNDGLEHRESSDIHVRLATLTEVSNRLAYGYLIPHEYTHAWNGKFRVPAGLVRLDFQQPQTTELLWVYEGLTRYLNWVLAARAGVLNYEESRDYAALLAAKVAHRPGRQWRSLQDTALSAGILNDAPDEWESKRRSVDYYDEALFIWLEVDTQIRQITRGKRSLDDFCRLFFGPSRDAARGQPYVFDDIVATLNTVAPYDWQILLRDRLLATGADKAPLQSLEASGWTLRYRDSVGSVQAARDRVRGTVEERFSIGVLAQESGDVTDVIDGSAAWRAGAGPGMKITRVGSEPWSPEAFRSAIGHNVREPLALTLQSGVEWVAVRVEHAEGARYPYLARADGQDLMAEILRPRTGP